MSNSEAKRQKKLAKKRAKDKNRHKQIAAEKQALTSGHGKMLAASQGEIVGCYRCDGDEGADSQGMIPVLLVRRGPRGLLALAQFLVDFWCMGVKDCLYRLDSPASINDLIRKIDDRSGLIEMDPTAGRAMVEGGVGYAENLGIAPHPDYRIAKLLWGNVPTGELPSDIEFGVDGKPFYFAGPFDDTYRQQEILKSLQTHAGEGNFKFVAGGNLFEDSEI